ncbi:MAG: PEP-CTERM sorting domain-containing protein, partial [Betaproteobacteria bacterium]|nr:PEP-CTERM sorting domain-containing protein [Betaproteobacteria bacterium]
SGTNNFSSDYVYVTGANSANPEGTYSVVTKANDVHSAWGNYFDRTSGNSSGKYFIANASADTTQTVWQSNLLNVASPGTAYRFEAYLMSIYPSETNYPRLSFEIGNGSTWTSMGQTTTLNSSSRGSWIFTYAGLDDIYFGLRTSAPSSGSTPGLSTGSLTTLNPSSVPEPSALSLLVVGIGGLIALRRVRRKADLV